MPDRRALLTDREREIIADEADVSDSYRYQTISRVRQRFERLEGDLDAFRAHGDLLDELRDIVCTDAVEDNIADSDSSPAASNAGTRDTTPPPEDDIQDAEDALRNLNLAGSGSKYESRVNAVLAFYDYLRNHPGERVERADLEDVADERDLDLGYSSFGSFWGNWIKRNASQGREFNTLAQLPGVEMDGDEYVYTGETDE